MVDWNGDPNELLTLQDAATLIPGADANTLKRLIRRGKLRAYRPGKKYLTTRADVHAAVIACRVSPPGGLPSPSDTSNSLGLTTTDLANLRLDRALGPAKKRKAAQEPPST
jgi:excisionase family DNA binding protein